MIHQIVLQTFWTWKTFIPRDIYCIRMPSIPALGVQSLLSASGCRPVSELSHRLLRAATTLARAIRSNNSQTLLLALHTCLRTMQLGMMLTGQRLACYRPISCTLRSQICERARSVVPKSQSLRRYRTIRTHAASTGSIAKSGEEKNEAAGPRCYLVPSDDGVGLEQICITEGKLDIGLGDSDYYFTANTGDYSATLLN